MAHKDYKALFKELDRQGWELEEIQGHHYKAFPPDKDQDIVCFATTSGDPRAMRNTIRDLRKSGFQWPPPKQEEPMDATLSDAVTSGSEPPRPPKSADELFEELKEAKGYFDLAKEASSEAEDELKELQERYAEALEELQMATNKLKEAKSEFDRAFSSEMEDG